MKNLALILSLVLLSATISSAGHKGWSWGWWMPKPPKSWEKPERPEKPEGEDQEKPERPEKPEAPEAEDQERPERPERPEAPEGEEGKVFGNGNLPEFLVKYDLNEDGVLDEEEKQAAKDARKNRAKERRAKWDADEDGKISKEEREAARDELRAKIEEKRLSRFAEVDTDGDGSLSAEEFGAIGSIERLAKWSPKSVERIFSRLDDDESAGITADEFTLHLKHCRHHKGKGSKRPKGDKDKDKGDDEGEEVAEENEEVAEEGDDEFAREVAN